MGNLKDHLNACIRSYSLSPEAPRKIEKTPNFMCISVREKMATSPYYKGNLQTALPEETSLCGRVRNVFRSKKYFSIETERGKNTN